MPDLRSCALDVAPIRAEPDALAEQVTQALRGEPLAVEERLGGWARIRTAYDYPGWIAEEALDGEPERDWLPPPGGDPVAQARAYLGAPYLWGGMSEHGIDCSGLVHMAYRRCGRLVPRDGHQQEEAGTAIGEADALPGDLVTYADENGTAVTHVAFWLGGGRILHATGRTGVGRVVEEVEPADLRRRRRGFVRLRAHSGAEHPLTERE